MESRDIFRNLSPLDHRYWQSNRVVFESLSDIVSEQAAVRYCARVEIALVVELLRDEGHLTDTLEHELGSIADSIDADEVASEEEKTQHNVRALVNVLKRRVPAVAAPYVHLGATSVDILDTASAMRLRDAVLQVLIPKSVEVVGLLCDLSEKHARTEQIGRTHGQFAVPITFGFACGEYASRLSKSLLSITACVDDLRGKIAGAVGAYNATSIVSKDPIGLEERILSGLGLKPSDHSTQLVEPEHTLRVLLELNTAFGIIANLADDMRHLQRSEISEVREAFESTQVGSSTMPHKRNPWNWEHIKSLWKTFSPRVITFYMDQISEHQRDLTNSASGRFVAEYLAGYAAAFERTSRVLSRIEPDEEQMKRNLDAAGDMSMAEPAYILLALAGRSDAHEGIRVATLTAQKEHVKLVDALRADSEIWGAIDEACTTRLGVNADSFFSNPSGYRGMSVERAEQSAQSARERIARVRSKLERQEI